MFSLLYLNPANPKIISTKGMGWVGTNSTEPHILTLFCMPFLGTHAQCTSPIIAPFLVSAAGVSTHVRPLGLVAIIFH